MNTLGSITTSTRPAVAPRIAVAGFLRDVVSAVERTFPKWHKTLVEGIEECQLGYDQRRAVLDVHPLDDYYFAGAVALEAWNIRQLFSREESAELLSLIGEQVDAVANRKDRIVSDLVFFIIGRLDLIHADSSKMPYDQVVRVILERIGTDKIEATEHLMHQVLYRHSLGEPLALGLPKWWIAFRRKYALAHSEAQPQSGMSVPAIPAQTSAELAKVRVRQRARLF